MAFTNINGEDRLVQATFADYLRDNLGWESVYAYNTESFGPGGSLGRDSERDAVLAPDLRAVINRLNPNLPESARAEAFQKLTQVDFSKSLAQHNQTFFKYIRDGVPVSWRDANDEKQDDYARVIDFADGETDGVPNNRFLAVRELKMKGLRVPHYNRRADIVCFVNGLPLVGDRTESGLSEHSSGIRRQPDGLHDRAVDRSPVSSQCVSGRQQRRPRQVRLDHQ